MQTESLKIAKLGVLDQLSVAAQPQNRLALATGAVLGGLIPIASFIIAHYEAHAVPLKWILVCSGMLYSATSVYHWGTAAFHSKIKSIGFVVLVEGVSIFSDTFALSIAAVSVLVLVNAASTGCNLLIDRKLARSAGARPSRVRPSKSKKTASRSHNRLPSMSRVALPEPV